MTKAKEYAEGACPLDYQCRLPLTKHRSHGLHFLALTDEKGRLIWISVARPGLAHDNTAARHNHFQAHLRTAGLGALADLGFRDLDNDMLDPVIVTGGLCHGVPRGLRGHEEAAVRLDGGFDGEGAGRRTPRADHGSWGRVQLGEQAARAGDAGVNAVEVPWAQSPVPPPGGGLRARPPRAGQFTQRSSRAGGHPGRSTRRARHRIGSRSVRIAVGRRGRRPGHQALPGPVPLSRHARRSPRMRLGVRTCKTTTFVACR
ncbi:transposase family protein [Streptomyces sp. NPDC017890]|uniref:transposase family protein n=1 Tax=Streptomyces sp. NPDC017890 TaxID=3365015 RepID=UPI00378790D8